MREWVGYVVLFVVLIIIGIILLGAGVPVKDGVDGGPSVAEVGVAVLSIFMVWDLYRRKSNSQDTRTYVKDLMSITSSLEAIARRLESVENRQQNNEVNIAKIDKVLEVLVKTQSTIGELLNRLVVHVERYDIKIDNLTNMLDDKRKKDR